jgi:hypothetical protein
VVMALTHGGDGVLPFLLLLLLDYPVTITLGNFKAVYMIYSF